MFTGRTSVTLLGYALMPWLLLVVYHGVRSPRGRDGAAGCGRPPSPWS